MKTITALCSAAAVLLTYLVLAAIEDVRERRKKRRLGSAYEGPLED